MSGCLGGGRPQRAVNGPVSGPHPGLRLGDGEWAQLASACRRAAKLVDACWYDVFRSSVDVRRSCPRRYYGGGWLSLTTM